MLNGALTALCTPMAMDGALDLKSLKDLVERQISAGIDGLVPCGTTGEASTLSGEERFQVIRTTVEQARGRVPVIAGAGANSTAAAVAAGALAAEAGADALLSVTPYYNKPSQDGLLAHFRAVADQGRLPVVLYNVPGRTGCDLLPATVARAAAHPRIVGIKEATGDLRRGSQVLTAVPEGFSVLSGDDFTCAALCTLGGAGVISVVSNLLPAETAALVRAARAGDLARVRELHFRLFPLMEMLFVEPSPAPTKAGLAMMGIGTSALRLPLLPMTEERQEGLRALLASLGVLP